MDKETSEEKRFDISEKGKLCYTNQIAASGWRCGWKMRLSG